MRSPTRSPSRGWWVASTRYQMVPNTMSAAVPGAGWVGRSPRWQARSVMTVIASLRRSRKAERKRSPKSGLIWASAISARRRAAISLDDFETAFTAKLFAYIHAIRQAQVTRSITMISAASARAALPGTVTFAAVNGAIERIVSPLAAELAPVRVNAVSPGVVDTPWWSFLPEDQRQAQFDAAAGSVPAGRTGTAADVADAIDYLLHASLVTGTILPVDGGFTVA